jgi:NADH-quinone oxidoreductase subunit D
LSEQLTGARFTTSYTRVGGQIRDLPDGFIPAVEKFMEEMLVTIDEVDRLLSRNKIFLDRSKDLAVISREDAISFGVTGPNLRSSGVDFDLRKARPYLIYDDLDFEVPLGEVGDCYDRYLVRMAELRQSVYLLHQCLDKLPEGPVNYDDGKIVLPPKSKVLTSMEELIHQFMNVTQGVDCPPGEVYFGAENPKGEL